MELVRSAFSPVPILTAPYFEQEVDRRRDARPAGDEVFGELEPRELLYDDLSQELVTENGTRDAAAAAPVRREGRHRAEEDRDSRWSSASAAEAHDHAAQALAAYRPRGARFEDGALQVTFEREEEHEPAER